MKIYPFKFLDSYTKDDTDLFFGRDEEIRLLYDMVFQTDILLIYGASGTGKTSLIQCGLASKFETHDWLALNIRRGNNLNQSFQKALAEAGGEKDEAQENDLDWLNNFYEDNLQTEKKLTPLEQSFKNIYLKYFKPIYLIFDQFEELYILGSKEEQNQFIQTVQEILTLEQPVKIIISIREEYLGYLYEFERIVPQLLRKKLRVEPMNLDRVRQVIVGATSYEHSNVSLKQEETDQVTAAIFEKIKGKTKSLTIQLPYLQVFLDKLYLKITSDQNRQADAVFNMKSVGQLGEIEDVLRDFLEEQVQIISRRESSTHQNISEDNIWQILSPLVTLEGTKEPITLVNLQKRVPNIEQKAIQSTLNALTNSRIIRFNENGSLYEIAHDALALQIASKRSDEEIALLEIRRLISSQTALQENARELFSKKQLNFIEPFLETLREQNLIDKAGEDLIAASRQQIEFEADLERNRARIKLEDAERQAAKERSLRRISYIVAAVAVGIAALATVFYFQSENAKQKAVESTIRMRQAFEQQQKAENDRKAIQAAKDSADFEILISRANTILDVQGCPKEILAEMEDISTNYRENEFYKDNIAEIKARSPNCKYPNK